MTNDQLLIADASTLLNFLKVKRFDLVYDLGYKVRIVDAVYEEVKSEKAELDRLMGQGKIRTLSLEGRAITHTVARLLGRGIGTGESFSIAAAIEFESIVAIDDMRAIKRAREEAPGLVVLTTTDIVVESIRSARVTVEEADQIKTVWAEEYRFRLKFSSFSELLETGDDVKDE